MRLPNGYTELEWIESSGTQWIDTGFKPDQTSRIVADVQFLTAPAGNAAIFGTRKSNTLQFWAYYRGTSGWYVCRYGSVSDNNSHVAASAVNRTVVDMDGCNMTVNGTTVSVTSDDFTQENNAYLFGENNAGSLEYASAIRMYSCRIYDNGAIVRDFVPCINAGGTVGMYDTVNGDFYKSGGNSAFTAGAAAPLTPSAPSQFSAMSSAGAVSLEWEAVDDAEGYRIYRNGVPIAETDGTSYTDTGAEKYSGVRYTLAAVNEVGEGDAVSADVIVKGSDRPLSDLITDRTAADVSMKTRKGAYNASDLNRVTAAAEYVHALLENLGYRTTDQTGRQWFTNDIPDRSEMNAHHEAVTGLDVIAYAHKKVDLPPSLTKLTYEGANNIEKFLLLCGEAAERIPEGYIYADETFGGDG